MNKYFVLAHSFAAPLLSDERKYSIEAETPEAALDKLMEIYVHPSGLYAAAVYEDVNAQYKGKKPVLRWLSNLAQLIEKITKGEKSYSFKRLSDSQVDLNGVTYEVPNAKQGAIVS